MPLASWMAARFGPLICLAVRIIAAPILSAIADMVKVALALSQKVKLFFQNDSSLPMQGVPSVTGGNRCRG